MGGEPAAAVRLGGDHGLVAGDALPAVDDAEIGHQVGALEGAEENGHAGIAPRLVIGVQCR